MATYDTIIKQFPSSCTNDPCNLGESFVYQTQCLIDDSLGINNWNNEIRTCVFDVENFSTEQQLISYRNKFGENDPEYLLVLDQYCKTNPTFEDCGLLETDALCFNYPSHASCEGMWFSTRGWKILVIIAIVSIIFMSQRKTHK
jgi:hypothetical protein